jgi:hypothetical protein
MYWVFKPVIPNSNEKRWILHLLLQPYSTYIHTYIHTCWQPGHAPAVTRRASLSRYLDVSSTFGRLDIELLRRYFDVGHLHIKTLIESRRYQWL